MLSCPARSPGPNSRRPRFKPLQLLFVVLLGLLVGLAAAQQDAVSALEEARALAAQARATYDIHTPDQPLWREALVAAQQAARLAPDDPEVTRTLALLYSETNWHVRAFELWRSYLAEGGTLDFDVPEGALLTPSQAYAEAGTRLGYSRYAVGDAGTAFGYYSAVLEYLPEHAESLYWAGLLSLELGDYSASRDYFSRLLEVDPGHETARDYLELIEERETVGAVASDAYREGLVAYEQGRLLDALEHFDRALGANASFANAAAWAGRVALESDLPARAAEYWQRVLQVRPDDQAAAYFLEVARTQARYGVVAGRAYFAGISAYSRGELEQAADAFSEATEANPTMLDAWRWAARVHSELGEPEAALHYWQSLLEREPEDEEARFGAQIARQQLRHGLEAGRAFAYGIRYYQLAEYQAAEQAFREAVAANPGLAEAWGWLGRIYFDREEYGEAAQAFGRAQELEPGNDDYEFFAREAAALAEEER